MSLLEKAMQVKRKLRVTRGKFSEQEIDELIRAFLEGKVSYMQVGMALTPNNKSISNAVYSKVTQSVRRMLARGELAFVNMKK